MARRNNRRNDEGQDLRPASSYGVRQIVELPDGEWVVKKITGAASTKMYRCPGCDQEIRPATPHVVAWPFDNGMGEDTRLHDRRHWHTPCWNAKARRGSKRG